MDARVKPGHDDCVCVALIGRHSFAIAPNCFFASYSFISRPLRIEGAGNAGRPMRPIAVCTMVVVERTHVVRSHRNHPAFPTQWFTDYTCPCVRKICQNMRTGGSHQPPVAGSEPVRAQRPQEPDGGRGTGPGSSSTRTVH